MELVLSKILRGAIEDVYQIPFRLLGTFGKEQLNKKKKKNITLNILYMFLIAFTTNQTIIITINTRFFEKISHVSFFLHG